jgi:hypothetical protein
VYRCFGHKNYLRRSRHQIGCLRSNQTDQADPHRCLHGRVTASDVPLAEQSFSGFTARAPSSVDARPASTPERSTRRVPSTRSIQRRLNRHTTPDCEPEGPTDLERSIGRRVLRELVKSPVRCGLGGPTFALAARHFISVEHDPLRNHQSPPFPP